MHLPGLPRSNRGTWAFAAVAVIVAVVVAVIAVHALSSPKNTVNTSAAFTNPPTTTTTAPPPKANNFTWPIYGYTPTRTRDFSAATNLNPPFRTAWSLGGNALLEFPATIWGNNLYFLDGGATVKRVNIKTGKQIWMRHLGKRSASSPALDVKDKLLFVTVLSTVSASIDSFDGEIAAVSMLSGKVVWTHHVPSGTESSPIVIGNSVYYGDAGGAMTSLNVLTGAVNWTYQTSGPIKEGPAYYDGNLYFGNYAGSFYAIGARSGKEVWSASPGGEFYSTPAIAFGRVYVGNNNKYVYSFVASSGTLAWSQSVGGYAYSGPAVASPKGLGPTVYIGSYDGDLYALNAQDGSERWAASVGGSISGSATVVGNTVYVSRVYNPGGSFGFNDVTGKQVFSFPDGRYTTVVADPNAIFLMGRYVLYKLVPKG